MMDLKKENRPCTLCIVRHGQTDWNSKRLVQGHQDIPLNDEGKRQAFEISEQLKQHQFSAVFSSDLSRAKETAEIITRFHRLAIEINPELRERYFGEYEGVLWDEIEKLKDATGGWSLPTVESNEQMERRVQQFLTTVVKRFQGQHVLVVTHGGVLHTIFSLFQLNGHNALKISNTGYVQISHSNGKFTLEQSTGIEFISQTPTLNLA